MQAESIIPSFTHFSRSDFLSVSKVLFDYQLKNNRTYQQFVDLLQKSNLPIDNESAFPFLPIRFFKSHRVFCGENVPDVYFESSGTTGQSVSRHFIRDLSIYENAFLQGFERQFGHPEMYCFIGLLPSYLERQHSSLIYMVNDLMKRSGHPGNGFYLNNYAELCEELQQLEKKGERIILFGTSFALLDFSATYSLKLSNTIIIETGGMKGRKKEMIRDVLVQILKKSFPMATIHSEYGMTELFSQAYAGESGLYHPPPWMKVLVRDEDDPLAVSSFGKGALNIIDLANVHSCSFIATDDVGEVFDDGSFRVLGRLDNSDIRGCSLLTI